MAVHDANYFLDHMEHAAGGKLDPRLLGLDDDYAILNEAGRYLFDLHEWQFSERPPVTLELTEGQDFVDLPFTFDRLGALSVSNTLISDVYEVTMERILFLRGSSLTFPFHYFVALTYPGQATTREQQGNPRLEIWPQPGSDSTAGNLVITFSGGWVEIVDNDQVPSIPKNMEWLLIELVRRLGASYADTSLEFQRMAIMSEVVNDPRMAALKKKYGMKSRTSGMPKGGVVPQGKRYVYRPFAKIGTAAEN